MTQIARAAVAAMALGAAGVASAAVITLTFEGIPTLSSIGDYYNGAGPVAENYGISFSPTTLAIVDSDDQPGATGNIANEPSGSTVMFFLDASNAILNFGAGFTDGFSFFYSSSVVTTVEVFDGMNGTGNVLASLSLTSQFSSGCSGDPNGDFCNWTAVGAAFAGTARSINFAGTANEVGFDNITFGSADPGGPVTPPPSGVSTPMTLSLVGVGLLALAATRRRKS